MIAVKTAVGPTILLASGSYFDLLDPVGSAFTIDDIAHGLSMTCRFAGQCREFYSVAEHSWHASWLVPPALARAALMHDAAEAFIGDVTRPLKSLLPAYKTIERAIEQAIVDRFAIDGWDAPEIKQADLQMLHDEQQAMMPAHDDGWSTSAGITTWTTHFDHWLPVEAKRRWLQRYDELTDAPSVALRVR